MALTRQNLQVLKYVVELSQVNKIILERISEKSIRIKTNKGVTFSIVFDGTHIKVFKYQECGKKRTGHGRYCFVESILFLDQISMKTNDNGIPKLIIKKTNKLKPLLRIVK